MEFHLKQAAKELFQEKNRISIRRDLMLPYLGQGESVIHFSRASRLLKTESRWIMVPDAANMVQRKELAGPHFSLKSKGRSHSKANSLLSNMLHFSQSIHLCSDGEEKQSQITDEGCNYFHGQWKFNRCLWLCCAWEFKPTPHFIFMVALSNRPVRIFFFKKKAELHKNQ